MRRLGLRIGGRNHETVQKYVAVWRIPTDHFDPNVRGRRAADRRMPPLEEVLVERSTYKRATLKERLYREA